LRLRLVRNLPVLRTRRGGIDIGGDETDAQTESGEVVATRFEGRLEDGRVTGAFTSYVADGRRLANGTWSVRRR
jgi:hypothetical protein